MTINLSGNSIRRTIGGRASITASQPIMVAKFVTSDVTAPSSQPAMTLVQPVEQFLSDYSFVVRM